MWEIVVLVCLDYQASFQIRNIIVTFVQHWKLQLQTEQMRSCRRKDPQRDWVETVSRACWFVTLVSCPASWSADVLSCVCVISRPTVGEALWVNVQKSWTAETVKCYCGPEAPWKMLLKHINTDETGKCTTKDWFKTPNQKEKQWHHLKSSQVIQNKAPDNYTDGVLCNFNRRDWGTVVFTVQFLWCYKAGFSIRLLQMPICLSIKGF